MVSSFIISVTKKTMLSCFLRKNISLLVLSLIICTFDGLNDF